MAETTGSHQGADDESRRDFLILTAGALGAVTAGMVAWPMINSMNPSADVLALSTTEVDISGIQTGQRITVIWQKKPVFVDHRTEQQISAAQSVEVTDLPDPQADAERVKRPEWLVMVGICTHLGCIPKGQRSGDPTGEFGGWFCPCHGSHYDTSGRIRKGPAPRNLVIPPYEFIDDGTIRIG